MKDIVDGDIKKSDDKKLTKNGYLIDSNVDTKKAGTYKVKIIAYDVNGNKTEKEYVVTVKEKPEVPIPSQNQTQQQQTSMTTSQNQGSTNSSINNTPSNNQTQTCEKNGTWKSSFDGSFASYDYNEALTWGKENCPENHQAMIYTIHDVCGYQAFGVYFFPTHQ